jgi:tetratricopeptide (TPR) repeat protein
MHPTGVAGLMPLMHLASGLPIGTLGFRFALMSAAFAALTVAFMCGILRRRELPGVVLWSAALWLLAGLTFSRQARVVEIYTFGSMLLAGTLWGFDPRVTDSERLRARIVGVFCAVLGVWGFGDLRLALAIPVALTWFSAFRRGRAWALWAPMVVVLASLTVFQIALSSARAPVADWGDPDSAHRLWQHLNAASIRAAFDQQIFATTLGPWVMHGRAMLERLGEDLGPFGPLAALMAMVLLARDPDERPTFWMLLGLLLVETVYIVGINPMGGADRQTGIPVAVAAVLAVALAAGSRMSESGPRQWLGGPILLGVLVLPAGMLSLPDFSVTRSWAPHAWTREHLSRVSSESLLVTQSDDLAAGSWAAQSLEGARPDLVIVPAQHLYRKLPDRAREDGRALLLAPAFEACTEAERARALAVAHREYGRGQMIAEAPGSEMLSALPWRAPEALGMVLGEVRADMPRDGAIASPELFTEVVRVEIEALQGLLPTHEDQRRLATALSSRVRAWLRVAGHDERNNQAAIDAYRVLFESLQIELPGPLVSLGALVDRAGDSQAAIALTREALTLDPDRRLALSNLALYLSRQPETRAEALDLARRVTELYPQQIASWRRLEQICDLAKDTLCRDEASARRAALSEAKSSRARAQCEGVGTSVSDERPTP